MTVSDLAAILRRGWWIIAAFAVIGIVAGAIYGSSQPTTYSSTTHGYVVVNNSGTSGGDAFNAGQAAQSRMASYAAIATTPAVTSAVAQALGLSMTPADVASHLAVSFAPGTLLVDVTATAETQQLATDLAAETLRQLQRQVETLETPAPGVPQWARLTAIQEPTTVTVIEPAKWTFVIAGLLGGTAVGALLAYAYTKLFRRVDTFDQLSKTFGQPVISADNGPEIRARVTAAGAGAEHPVVVSGVDASSWPVARDLASSLNATGESVLVVDARPSGPGATEARGMTGGPGLAELLKAEQSAVPQSIIDVATPRPGAVTVLPAGVGRVHLPDLLAASTAGDKLTSVVGDHDYVVVDGLEPTVRPFNGSAVRLVVVGLGQRSEAGYRDALGADAEGSDSDYATVLVGVRRPSLATRLLRRPNGTS